MLNNGVLHRTVILIDVEVQTKMCKINFNSEYFIQCTRKKVKKQLYLTVRQWLS